MVSRVDDYLERYKTYVMWLNSIPSVGLVKYETMIDDFNSWLDDFMDACCINDDKLRDYLYDKHHRDVDPSSAVRGSHKNKMVAGQYLSLDKNTIDYLNARFKPVLKVLGYLD